jgi:hypothetical protein
LAGRCEVHVATPTTCRPQLRTLLGTLANK